MDIQISFSEIKATTEKAYLIRFEDGEEVWFPKSQVHVDKEDYDITLPSWLVDKNNLDKYIIAK